MADSQFSSRTIMLGTIALAIVLIVVIWPLSMLGKGDPQANTADEAELRIQPIARVEMVKAPVKTDGKPRDALTVYNAVCKACHETGVAGAPKTGDKAAWTPRIASGASVLLKSALNGKNGMPARGGSADLTDGEIKAAVDYLIKQAK